MKTSNKPISNWTIDALVEWGVKTIICSPGSRNAPLIMSAVAHPSIEVITILDERSAAFMALGMIQQQHSPVAVCCTSGSALANYHPAVLEAFHSRLPLVIVSADRPADRIYKGEGQTCYQKEFYHPHIGKSVHLDETMSRDRMGQLIEEVSHSINNHFPVHLNISFEEPLYDTTEFRSVEKWGLSMKAEVPKIDVSEVRCHLEKSRSTVILIGQLTPPQSKIVRAILSEKDWVYPVFADPTSGLLDHTWARPMNAVLELQPDTVISLGGQWIDKKPKFHLRSLKLQTHLHIDPYHAWEVTDASSFIHVKTEVDFILQLIKFIEQKIPKVVHAPLYRVPEVWSDALAAYVLFQHVQSSDILHLSNSTAVRYFGFFPKQTNVLSNRGVAGIDGSLSTAIGAAIASPYQKHWCLIGDQSFIYDSNALNIPSLPDNLTIVVLNNGVGAIFDWLPGAREADPQARAVFSNPMKVNLEAFATAYHANFTRAGSGDELRQILMSVKGCTLVDANTMESPNTDVALRLLASR